MAVTVRNDPRQQPGAYICDEKRLYEVLRTDDAGKWLVLQDCSTDMERQLPIGQVTQRPWRLVRAAPCAPDSL